MEVKKYSQKEKEAMINEVRKECGFPSSMSSFNKLHTVEGVQFTEWIKRESLMAIRDLEMKEDDILVVTFPKSGTHWIWEITLLLLAEGHPEKIDRKNMYGTRLEVLIPPEMKVPSHEIFENMKSPRIILTHLPWQFLPKQATEGKTGKIIYLMRNPKDILASNIRFYYEKSSNLTDKRRAWEFFLHCFLSGSHAVGYGSWFDHVHTYWRNKDQQNVFFTSYEELKLDFLSVAKQLSKFLHGHELDEDSLKRTEEHASVKGMKKNYDDIEKQRADGVMITKMMGTHSFIQKGVIGSWKDCFTVAENELFDKVAEEKMSGWEFRPIYE